MSRLSSSQALRCPPSVRQVVEGGSPLPLFHSGAASASPSAIQPSSMLLALHRAAAGLGILLVLWVGMIPAAAHLSVAGLKCEYRVDPLGLDTAQPRLSWVLESRDRAQAQAAWQVLAATSPRLLVEGKADLWDSGRVTSGESIHIVYGGRPLRSGERVYWQARVWDAEGQRSAWSPVATFEIALLRPQDWSAQWICRPRAHPRSEQEMFGDDPAPLFRKEFALEKKVRRARVYVSGLGYYELTLNGRLVGDQVLDPGWTSYEKRVLYSTFDVTDQLRSGTNAVGVMLGNGWYNPLPLRLFGQFNLRNVLTVGEPRLLLQLVVQFEDGSSRTLVTDPTWKVAPGPVRRNNVYLGEVYDARAELPGWDQPGFDDSQWTKAATASGQLGQLCAQDAPPIRITRTFKPVAVTQPKPGISIYDLGQNFAGWVNVRATGPAGARVRLRYGELLYPDGTLNGMTSVAGQIKGGGPGYRYEGSGPPRTAFQQDEFILKGQGEESWRPRFTFHGFRYVEVTGDARLTSLEGLGLNSDVRPAGQFECSNPLLNRIQKLVLCAELSNLFSVQSDCPHREKLGYGGDIVASSEMGMLNFDMSRFYAKAVRDLQDAARTNGGFTETAPYVGIESDGLGGGAGPVGWATAHPFLLAQLYQYYGDRRLVEEQYPAARRWLEFLRTCAQDGILDNGISDHESLAPKPRALTGTGFYYLNADRLAVLARILGRTKDAGEAESLAASIRSAFNGKFLHAGTGRYDTGSQACQAFALHLGLVPPAEAASALDVLVNDVQDRHDGHLTTGIFGTKFMLETLSDCGRPDIAYAMVSQRTFPGWGFMLENGATTLWEHWELSDNTYSHNHPMFGSVSEWLYKSVAGIAPAEDAVGFNRVVIRPEPVGDLQWARGSYDSVRGKISTSWRRERTSFQLHLKLPPGVSATVLLPGTDKQRITESGKPLDRVRGVHFERVAGGKTVLAVASGEYTFRSPLP